MKQKTNIAKSFRELDRIVEKLGEDLNSLEMYFMNQKQIPAKQTLKEALKNATLVHNTLCNIIKK